MKTIAQQVDFVFCAVDMSKEETAKLEDDCARSETPVVSNNSAHRGTPDVPVGASFWQIVKGTITGEFPGVTHGVGFLLPRSPRVGTAR